MKPTNTTRQDQNMQPTPVAGTDTTIIGNPPATWNGPGPIPAPVPVPGTTDHFTPGADVRPAPGRDQVSGHPAIAPPWKPLNGGTVTDLGELARRMGPR